MKVLETSEIPFFPDEVLIGWSKISGSYDENIPFINADVLKSFSNQKRREEHITSRVLFAFLATQMGWDADTIELDKEAQGKPFVRLNGKRGFVSFTHTKELVMCAISETLDIGIDAELERRDINPGIIKRILGEEEWANLEGEDSIKLWTLKEAAVKSLGTGLRTNLKDLELSKEDSNRFSVSIGNNVLNAMSTNVVDHYIALAYPVAYE